MRLMTAWIYSYICESRGVWKRRVSSSAAFAIDSADYWIISLFHTYLLYSHRLLSFGVFIRYHPLIFIYSQANARALNAVEGLGRTDINGVKIAGPQRAVHESCASDQTISAPPPRLESERSTCVNNNFRFVLFSARNQR